MIWRAPLSYAWMYSGIWESIQKSRVALGYRLEQLSRFFRALPTFRVHHHSVEHAKS